MRRNLAELDPELAEVAFSHRWGGNIALTTTRLPLIRRIKPGLYAAGGYSGNGLDKALLAGRILSEAIYGDERGLTTFAALPMRAFPGGEMARFLLLYLAMFWFLLRDRLG